MLKPGGRLIASVEHPPIIAYMIQDPLPNYLATNSYSFDWTFNGKAAPMTFWRRPLHAMTDAFAAAGFCLSLISEPQPDPPLPGSCFPTNSKPCKPNRTFCSSSSTQYLRCKPQILEPSQSWFRHRPGERRTAARNDPDRPHWWWAETDG